MVLEDIQGVFYDFGIVSFIITHCDVVGTEISQESHNFLHIYTLWFHGFMVLRKLQGIMAEFTVFKGSLYSFKKL